MFLFWINDSFGGEKCSDSYPEETKGGAWGTQRSTYTASWKEWRREKGEQNESSTSREYTWVAERKRRSAKSHMETRWAAERIWKIKEPCRPAATEYRYSTFNSG